jgi:hypothetical protein
MKALSSFALVTCLFFAGCNKEDIRHELESTDPTVQEKSMFPPYFLYSSTVGTFSVYRMNSSCVTPWGGAEAGDFVYALGTWVTTGNPSYVRASEGWSVPDDGYLALARGSSANTFGPWYLIVPNFGPNMSTRKCLRFRVKNISTFTLHTYEREFTYTAASNSWTWQPSTVYEVQQITPGILTLCGIH